MPTTTTDDKPIDQAATETNIARQINFGELATNWDSAIRIAKVMAQSALVPKAYQNHWEDIVVAMQMAAEMGLPPMAALQSIAVINGKPGLYGDGFLAVIVASPYYVKHAESYVTGDGEVVDSLTTTNLQDDETRAVCKFWRRGIADPFVAEFSIADAKRARLLAKDGPWRDYTARMMKMRARGFAGRDAFADVLRGIRIAEEIADIDDAPSVSSGPTVIDPPVRRSQKPAHTDPRLVLDDAPPPPPPTVSQVVDGLIITDTAVLRDGGWEVRARVDKPGAPPIAYVFVTSDQGVYDLAASAEGTAQHFRMMFHGEPPRVADAKSKERKVLDELVAD